MSDMIDFDAIDDIENIQPVEEISNQGLIEDIKDSHLKALRHADEEARKLFTEIQKKQEQISYLQKVIQGINAGVNDKGDLDLTNNPQLKEMLKEAEERFGLKLSKEKQKYTAQEWQRLIENTKSMVDDINSQMQLQLNEVNRVNNKLSEIVKMFDTTLKGIHHTIMEMARNNK